jgi:hypothetical protein
MSQGLPALPVTGEINVTSSTRENQRDSHGLFRYFGKLAPDVTGAVLDAAAELAEVRSPVVDLMCGSGTTLIEADRRGWRSIGLDVNPVAALYAQVKTRALDIDRYDDLLARALRAPAARRADVDAVFGATRNASRWFSDTAMREVAALRLAIDDLPRTPESDALRAALLGRLRRSSNASARTGRIFFDPASAEPARPAFRRLALELRETVPPRSLETKVLCVDARATGLDDESTDLSFCHPPYFALYRYSADVLRFEMEIGGFSRKATNKLEIREGWKSGDPDNLVGYLQDMTAVFQEARRITRRGGVFALVASNSTLGDRQLPVIDGLAAALDRSGWKIEEHLRRPAHFGSAKYHRSARSDKVMQQDHVLLAR